METVLMVVTLVALVLAVGMSVVAWRLLRDDRQRSTARSEALRDMAAEPDVDDEPEPETRRTPARVAEPRRQIRPAPRSEPAFDEMRFWNAEDEPRTERETDLVWDAPPAAPPQQVRPRRSSPARAEGAHVPEPTFGANAAQGPPARRWAALAAAAVIMAGAAGAVYVLSRPQIIYNSQNADGLSRSSSSTTDARPIELLSLRHAADPDGSFTVTGLVQNPLDGRLARHVIAVVYVFDRDGHYFASGKAALDFTALQPGEESPFVVHIPNVGRISRYRVGFRSEEGGVVAHVDRRGQLPGGTTGDAIEPRPVVAPTTSTRRSEG